MPSTSLHLVTGATGFVGTRLCARLEAHGQALVGATRNIAAAQKRWPGRSWRTLDVETGDGLPQALEGVKVAYYLVHAMSDHRDYEARERAAALRFREAAAQVGVERIVYLGGVAPQGPASMHLRSRLATGEILRGGKVPCVELRAGMIVGSGSASWKMVRDLSARLPVMVLPRWLRSRSQPVAVDDVIFALESAATIPLEESVCYSLPGPEILSAKEVLLRVSRLRGYRPITVDVPVITPRLSSHWIRFVTSADPHLAAELVEGLRNDLIAKTPPFWDLIPTHALRDFDTAALEALSEDHAALSLRARVLERLVRTVAPGKTRG